MIHKYIQIDFFIQEQAIGFQNNIVHLFVGTDSTPVNGSCLLYTSTFNVREDLLKNLTMGAEFEAIVPALDNKTIKLKVDYMKDLGTYAAWKVTKTTGQFDLKTFEVRARPMESVEGLRPGMSVIIKK